MKVLSISNSNNTLVVNYLTDLISKAENFVPLQIKTITNGVETMGISDAAMVLGFPHKQVQHHIEFYTNFCKQKGYTLTSYENVAGGITKTTIWAGGYGTSGAIGESEL